MPTLTLLTFIALALSVGAIWIKPSPLLPLAPWQMWFAVALLCGGLSGVLHAPAYMALAVFGGAAWLTATSSQKYLRILAGVLTLVLAFALAIHKLPGFSNPVVIAGAVFSEGAKPFTQYANFDKGAVGLILLALICQRTASFAELGGVLRKTWPVLLVTVGVVMALATGAGFVHPAFKLPDVTPQFLAVNLFFTVVAEEAFFRGFVQARLASAMSGWRYGSWVAVACSALLFGAAHLAGGPLYAGLAAIAGLGYAYAYQRTERIEAPILVHIALNAVHFIFFTYP
ncbi:CPBP family intramembrane glutamic endopeptidase [Duganella sp. HH105]|uniref:CPBP family intramembrane glutamic endopeptidase n=1 Tax=Duganella sp. HH105 TaxID=1781067 RepID=UPI000877CBDC|nr:CPBP family intramembrane glutamic endopeptidase [Duganella sp. HH105]OEZ60666.1 CAAX amino terminal protease self- immunity [Duganella sp. HH105]